MLVAAAERWWTVLAAGGALVLAACSGSGSTDATSPPTLTLAAPFPSCPASVRAPASLDTVVPAATSAPVSQLQVGQALAFTVTASSRVASVGQGSAPEGDVVCRATSGSATRVVLVAEHRGFVRVGVKIGGQVRLVLVRVTG